VLEGFHIDLPKYISPVITFITIGYFFWRSRRELSCDIAKRNNV